MKILLAKDNRLFTADLNVDICFSCGKKWLLLDDHSKDYGITSAFAVWKDVAESHIFRCAINKSTEDSIKQLNRIIK